MAQHFGIVFVVFVASTSVVLAALPTSADFLNNFKPQHSLGSKIGNIGNRQFAVLFVTDADGSDTFDPIPSKLGHYDDKNLMKGKNYAANVIEDSEKDVVKPHTEDTLLKLADNLIEKYKSKNPNKTPILMLYTKNSPCCGAVKKTCAETSCSFKIAKFLDGRKDLILYLSWGEIYQRNYRNFLIGLNTMLTTKRVILHSLPSDNWLQDKMAKCFIGKNTVAKLFTQDQNGNENIRSMINKVVWQLGIGMGQNGKKSPIRDANEWKKVLDNGFEVVCKNLMTMVNSCLGKIDVGPPLKPADGAVSSSVADLRGEDYEFEGLATENCNIALKGWGKAPISN